MDQLLKIVLLCIAVCSVTAEKLRFHQYNGKTKVVDFHRGANAGPYQPNWDSIDSRPIPGWYDEAKFGIFMHWGVYSVPGFGTEWFWRRWKDGEQRFVDFMKENYPPRFQYPDFGPMFTAEMFDANHFADVLDASGAQYVVFTSKHHEGFTNWASNYSWNWNAVDLGPNRDLVGELAAAVRSRTNIKFGLYYSLFEWFHPLFLKDQANDYTTNEYIEMVMMPQLHEIVNQYKPALIWSDGDWMCPDTYWNSTSFLAWLYNESPVKDYVVVNDRWGDGDACHHGGYFTCNDRYNPGKIPVLTEQRTWQADGYGDTFKDYVVVNDRWGKDDRCLHGGYYTCQDRYDPGVLQPHKWENCFTIDKTSWGYRRDTTIADYLTMDDITQTLAETISCGGNLLMNFGPTHDGRIIPVFEERLRQTGAWLKVNGEAVYGSSPWKIQNDTLTPGVWYTTKDLAVYAFVLDWPDNNTLDLGGPTNSSGTVISMLGVETPLKWQKATKPGASITVSFPVLAGPQLPCDWAWVLKMTKVY